jgi:hypothetical protein
VVFTLAKSKVAPLADRDESALTPPTAPPRLTFPDPALRLSVWALLIVELVPEKVIPPVPEELSMVMPAFRLTGPVMLTKPLATVPFVVILPFRVIAEGEVDFKVTDLMSVVIAPTLTVPVPPEASNVTVSELEPAMATVDMLPEEEVDTARLVPAARLIGFVVVLPRVILPAAAR